MQNLFLQLFNLLKCYLDKPLENKDMKNSIVKTITRNAVVAAIYFLLTVAVQLISFGPIQIRLAESLVLLCFFRRDFTFGLTIGCLLANLFSPFMPWDLLIGTLATFLSCILVSYCKHLALATFIPVVLNGFAIGSEISFIFNYNEMGYWATTGFIFLGEFLSVSVIGYLLYLLVKRNKSFYDAIDANKNVDYKW